MAFSVTLAGVDVTTSLLYNSLTLKFNTFDFSLLDVAAPALGASVVTANPLWSGTVAAFTSADPVDLKNGHQIVTITATNTNTLPNDTAPFDLSDTPVALTDHYLLEDGSGHYLLESGTDFANGTTDSYLLEGIFRQGYRGLSVRKQAGSPPTTLGRCVVVQSGLRPGNTFLLTSANQGFSAVAYQINQATLTFGQGVNPPSPIYQIEFGDTPETLAQWTQISAPASVAPVTAPVVIPSGPTIYGNCSSAYRLGAQGEGIVTIASASFTVSAPPGHTDTVQLLGQIDCRARAWDNYIAVPRRAVRATISGGIYTGAWQEAPSGPVNALAQRVTLDLSSAPGIALADGTYTVSIQIDAQEFNQMEVFSAWAQAAVRVV